VTPPKKVTPFAAYEHTPAAVIAHGSRLLITDSHLIFISLVIFLLFLLSFFQAANVKSGSGTDDEDEGAELKVQSTAHKEAAAEEGDEDEVRHSHKRRPASVRLWPVARSVRERQRDVCNFLTVFSL
jgi:hypothetical protein